MPQWRAAPEVLGHRHGCKVEGSSFWRSTCRYSEVRIDENDGGTASVSLLHMIDVKGKFNSGFFLYSMVYHIQ